MRKNTLPAVGICVLLMVGWLPFSASSQQLPATPISLYTDTDNDLVPTQYFVVLEDKTGALTFETLQPEKHIPALRVATDHVENPTSTYWVLFEIMATSFTEANPIYLEFIDPHTNSLTVAVLRGGAPAFIDEEVGADVPFDQKDFHFKNYLFPLRFKPGDKSLVVVARVRSTSKTTLLFKIRSERDFLSNAKNEYYGLGIFYGMILISLITNLIIFLFVRERLYLFYTLYVLNCSLLFLSEDMLGFEYLWPRLPMVNELVANYSPAFLVLSFYFYSVNFIQLKNYFPRAHQWLKWLMGLSVLYLLFFAWYSAQSPSYHFYILPFLSIYLLGISIARKGQKAARYFVVAHSFIIIGIAFLVLRKLGISFFGSALPFFSLQIGFAIELAVLSYALGERLNHTKSLKIWAQEKLLAQLKTRQRAQQQLVVQLQENQLLKDKLNQELENEVRIRAAEIVEANEKLKQQAEQINKMNQLLDLDNWALKKNIKKITEERVLSKEVGFEEFSKTYPDHLACLRFLADMKWGEGYHCRKCGHTHFCDGKTILSKRCTRCRYEESPTAYTLLHKCKLPLDKAFYAIFLIYNRKGDITSVDLADQLQLRQSTCWSFLKKVKTAMKTPRKKGSSGWDSIILEPVTLSPAPVMKA
ncbi:MAG: hypothetical protein MUC38_07015 [Cyclobacteriaceae bacterium]|jgi:hypothetical protein|nr:hypothetical protein [Cyclobacteriaceae bacterium]